MDIFVQYLLDKRTMVILALVCALFITVSMLFSEDVFGYSSTVNMLVMNTSVHLERILIAIVIASLAAATAEGVIFDWVSIIVLCFTTAVFEIGNSLWGQEIKYPLFPGEGLLICLATGALYIFLVKTDARIIAEHKVRIAQKNISEDIM